MNKVDTKFVDKINSAIDKFQQGFDVELLDLIIGTESDLYSGTDEEGNLITLGIEKGVGLKKTTHQSNGWMRIDEYSVERYKEDNSLYVNQSEYYNK